MASSVLPLASTSAFLQSRRPAPVWPRSSLTICAVTGPLMSFSLNGHLAGPDRLPLRERVGVEGRDVDRDVDLGEVYLARSNGRRGGLGRRLGGGLGVRTALRAARVALGE